MVLTYELKSFHQVAKQGMFLFCFSERQNRVTLDQNFNYVNIYPIKVPARGKYYEYIQISFMFGLLLTYIFLLW